MAQPKKGALIQRRSPVRRRSAATVEVIFEAAAQILAAGGRAALTTNRIAERAGVSVGSIYAYFPNKEAILLAMARRELDAVRDRVVVALSAKDDPTHPLRRAIRALMAAYGEGGVARRILMETLFAYGGSDEMARPVHEVADLIAARAADFLPAGTAAPSPIGLFVLTRAVDGVIRTATYDGVDFLGSAAFEDELMRLIGGYFSTRAPPA